MPEDNDEINESVKRIAASQIPTARVTMFNQRYQLSAVAPTITADRLHGILRCAEAGDTQQLFALYRDVILSDSHLQAEFSKRKLAVLGDALAFLSADTKNKDDEKAAELIKLVISRVKGFTRRCADLMDGTLWPVAVLEKVFKPSGVVGLKYEVAELVMVDHQLLDYSTGVMMIRDTDPQTGTILATKQAVDPNRYIVHRGHLLSTADNWGGPMRAILFWWLLSTMDRDWWGRFLERYGAPFLVGKYDAADDASRSTLERAFSLSTRIGGLVVTRETEIEIKQALASASGDAFEKFLSICQREKSKLIVGQTLSSEAQATGMNSGVSSSQENVRDDIRQFDGLLLGEALRDQLFEQLLRINGLSGAPPRAVWGAESGRQAGATGKLLTDIATAGLEPSDEALPLISQRIGFQIQRKVSFPLSLAALQPRSLDANDRVASAAAADLAQGFRGSLAPIRQMILTSRSADELSRKVKMFYMDWSPDKVAGIIEQALVAYGANGVASVK